MIDSKYAAVDHGDRQASHRINLTKRKHKYGIQELNNELGIQEHYEYCNEVDIPLDTKSVEMNHSVVSTSEDMMDLDNIEDVTHVSDLILDHRQQALDYKLCEENLVRTEDYSGQLVPTKLTIFVVDTNFIVSHLHMLERLRELGSLYGYQIVIPSMVVRELDGLKSSEKYVTIDQKVEQNLGRLARAANDWIYRNLANLDSAVHVQRLNQRNDYALTKDDAILDCCLYFKNELDNFVVLLSNDKNLCLRALAEKLLTISFRQGMTGELIANKVEEERKFCGQSTTVKDFVISPVDTQIVPISDDFNAIYAKAYKSFEQTALDIVHKVMDDSYGDEIEFISYERKKYNNLRGVGTLIYSHYVSVFSEYFEKTVFRKEDWKHLPNELLNVPKTVSDLKNFVCFWSQVLWSLCRNSSLNEKNFVKSLRNDWMYICSSLEHHS